MHSLVLQWMGDEHNVRSLSIEGKTLLDIQHLIEVQWCGNRHEEWRMKRHRSSTTDDTSFNGHLLEIEIKQWRISLSSDVSSHYVGCHNIEKWKKWNVNSICETESTCLTSNAGEVMTLNRLIPITMTETQIDTKLFSNADCSNVFYDAAIVVSTKFLDFDHFIYNQYHQILLDNSNEFDNWKNFNHWFSTNNSSLHT